MKNRLKFACLLTLMLFIKACSNTNEPEGKWSDNIKLSKKNIEFDSNINTATITTKGDWWWVINVSVNDRSFDLPDTIDIEAESYIYKRDCFVIEKKDNKTLNISVDENLTNTERKIIVRFQAGNYFDNVVVIQKGK